jgi:hypothetical protein
MASKQTSETIVARTCAWCGREMAIAQRSGRPRRYCSKSCRNRASELRTAAPRLARQLAAGRLATGPVREVVERTVTELLIPVDAHGWTTALTELTRQLSDPCSKTSREHWQHRRILAALAEATAALDRAHSGGLRRTAGR